MSTQISSRHWSLKERARLLRSAGMSYREIVNQVGVSKASVSAWCRDVPLSFEQRDVLQNRRGDQMKGIRVAHRHYWKLRCEAFDSGIAKMRELHSDPIFVAGLMLYWAEGSKQKIAAIANSDEAVIKVMVLWFMKYFAVPIDSFSVHLHLHSGQEEEVEKTHWSSVTGISTSNFIKVFIKPEGSGYRKNILYHGTAKLSVRMSGSTYMLFTILGCIAGFQQIVLNVEPRPESWMERSQYAADE